MTITLNSIFVSVYIHMDSNSPTQVNLEENNQRRCVSEYWYLTVPIMKLLQFNRSQLAKLEKYIRCISLL